MAATEDATASEEQSANQACSDTFMSELHEIVPVMSSTQVTTASAAHSPIAIQTAAIHYPTLQAPGSAPMASVVTAAHARQVAGRPLLSDEVILSTAASRGIDFGGSIGVQPSHDGYPPGFPPPAPAVSSVVRSKIIINERESPRLRTPIVRFHDTFPVWSSGRDRPRGYKDFVLVSSVQLVLAVDLAPCVYQ